MPYRQHNYFEVVRAVAVILFSEDNICRYCGDKISHSGQASHAEGHINEIIKTVAVTAG